jgi:undecaprenyl-diphosphatase
MIDIVQIDQAATLWINKLDTPALYPLWMGLSDARIWFPAYALIMGFIIWKLGWKKGLLVSLSLILCVVLTDQLSGLVKDSVARLRPCFNTWMVENGVLIPYGQAGGLYGFFSSHAANVFGFAAASSLGLKLNGKPVPPYTWGIFIWASLVSLSRIMMAAHFLGDVLVGVVFGLSIGVILAYLVRLIVVKARL